jgi:hypothetical protein
MERRRSWCGGERRSKISCGLRCDLGCGRQLQPTADNCRQKQKTAELQWISGFSAGTTQERPKARLVAGFAIVVFLCLVLSAFVCSRLS